MEPPFIVRLQKQPLSCQALIQALRELVTNATFSSNINLVPRAVSGHCVVFDCQSDRGDDVVVLLTVEVLFVTPCVSF